MVSAASPLAGGEALTREGQRSGRDFRRLTARWAIEYDLTEGVIMGERKIDELVHAGELEHHPAQVAKKDKNAKSAIPAIRLQKPVDLQKVIRESKS